MDIAQLRFFRHTVPLERPVTLEELKALIHVHCGAKVGIYMLLYPMLFPPFASFPIVWVVMLCSWMMNLRAGILRWLFPTN